jgi:hypothetical protein
VLAAVLSSAAGKPYQQVVHDLIAIPLGLRTVGADQPYALVPDRSRFYVYRPDLGRTINAAFADNSYKWAGGGYLSSSEDLALFASALTAPHLLSAASLDILFSPQTLADGSTAMSGGCGGGHWLARRPRRQRPPPLPSRRLADGRRRRRPDVARPARLGSDCHQPDAATERGHGTTDRRPLRGVSLIIRGVVIGSVRRPSDVPCSRSAQARREPELELSSRPYDDGRIIARREATPDGIVRSGAEALTCLALHGLSYVSSVSNCL